ncbi:thiamine pyrophosphate-binding protein [Pseudonocardia endophytica]|uniref:Acetolactate synthase-1/2/3 large subunit n=1 Tax=Pseudonocardia endophytica TaxID=401976 RepID=A0A4R1HLX3_PSEEN|nr:thiamine pyrophosphate-binding protein [Pseudonocardia endophytica]TCK22111.1 acetolactate synthase-1/2/3 large subunit [Pseudonocardia endophytica]
MSAVDPSFTGLAPAFGRHEHRTGAREAAQALVDNGVTDLFGIHGYINPVIEEAVRLGARMWHFRHEQAAGFAAEAYGRMTRKPGVFFVSASAGMANALSSLSQGIGTRSPILLLVGQHGTAGDHLGILQEGYAAEAFTTVAKWTHRMTDWELNSYWVHKAITDSVSYPAGPVVLEFPLNNQFAHGEAVQRKYIPGNGFTPVVPQTQADPARVADAVEILAAAERPILLAGDGVYWSDGSGELVELAEYLNAPTGSRRTARGAISEKHPLAVAAGYRGQLLRAADTVLVVGLRAGELESWFEPPDWPTPDTATYIQIQETAEDLWWGLDSRADLVGSSKLVLRQILEGLKAERATDEPVSRPDWLARVESARSAFTENRAAHLNVVRDREPIHTYELAQAIADEADQDATIIYDSYQGSLYLTDAVSAVRPAQILDAGPRVALGQGVGMAFGAGVARPGSQIISLIGDGGIGLAGMDIETLIRYDVPAVLVVLNNSSWGGNSLMREDIQPDIGSWDMTPGLRYDRVFEPFGCHVEHVEHAADLRPALRRALDSGKVAVLNVVADSESIESSVPWLRLKIGEFYSRGIDDLSDNLIAHFRALSKVEALRLHKSALDNGTRIPLSFIAELCGHPESDLEELAVTSGYRY